MLSSFVSTERYRRRYLDTPFGPYLEGFLEHQQRRGFADATLSSQLQRIAAFGEYLLRRKAVPLVSEVVEADVEAFAEHYSTHRRRSGPRRRTPRGSVSLLESLRGALHSLLAYLRSAGIRPADVPSKASPYDPVLADYLAFLRTHCGFAEITIQQHRRWCAAFLGRLSLRHPPIELAKLSSSDVEGVALEVAENIGRRSRQIMASTLGSFMRYLCSVGQIPSSCAPFLPQLRRYAISSLPSTIPWSEVERAVDTMEQGDPMGRRDYALLRLVTAYGLRAGEVVALRLEDIGWRSSVIHVRQSKTHRTLDLPLTRPVRDALLAYLRNGRPATADRRVFQKCHAPRGAITRALLYSVVRKTLKKAGIQSPHFGPQILRHAYASALIRAGQPLKTIGDLLGHRVPEATLIYCKVDVEALRCVALDLPEVGS